MSVSANGWQTTLADLVLILFMVTVSGAGDDVSKIDATKVFERGDPVAVYAAVPGAPPLAHWLAEQSGDPREQLTITVFYGPRGQERAMKEGLRLLQEARTTSARVVVQPGTGPSRVVLAFDKPM